MSVSTVSRSRLSLLRQYMAGGVAVENQLPVVSSDGVVSSLGGVLRAFAAILSSANRAW